MNYNFIFFFLLNLIAVKAQLGIGTNNPKSLLHIVSTNTNNPTSNDGILIPRVSSFPINPKSKGQLVFHYGDNENEQGFYYWDGIDWNSLLINNFTRTLDKSIYVITGSGYSGSGLAEKNIIFNAIVSNNLNGFTLENNNITIGKKGTYLINFNSALKKNTDSYRATYIFKIKKNNNTIITSYNSIPNEATTASSISLSDMIKLEVGDVINATIQKLDESHPSNSYTGYGTNTITLTYLKD